jgi:hypothetical protein
MEYFMRQTGIFRRLFLCFFLCGFYFVSVAEEKEKLDPDKLQLLLDLSGEGSNKELERELALAVQAAWAENTPYHRYMFISSALDALGAMKSFSDFVDKSRQYDFALSLAQGTMLEKGVGRGQDNDVAASFCPRYRTGVVWSVVLKK